MAKVGRSLTMWRVSEALVWIGAAFSLATAGSIVLRDNSSMAESGPISFPSAVAVKAVLVALAVCAAVLFARRGSLHPRKSGLSVVGAALVVLVAGCLGLYNVLLAPTAALFLISGLIMLVCPPVDRAAVAD